MRCLASSIFLALTPCPQKTKNLKKLKKTHMEIGLSKWKVNSGQSTLHTNLEKINPHPPHP
jgi:hypothetical protein